MADDDDKMRPEYDFTNAVKNPHAEKLRAGTPCRLLECADGARKPVMNTIEWLSDDELATRNRALVETTQRWWPLPAQEREDLLHEVGALAPNACTHGQLKRQCEICGLESQVEFWHDEVNRLEAEKEVFIKSNQALGGRIEVLLADVDFAARKLMPAHDLLAECLNALTEEQPPDRHLALRGKIVQWLGQTEVEYLAGRKAE